jgi:NAD(P)-dependent dehydrogenase (short-subunit alcohol dehydrogenase family)
MAAQETAFIIGVGPGLSASLARLFAKEGMEIALGARNVDKLDALARETNAARFAIDVTDPGSVEKFFADAVADKGTPDIVVYNPSARTRGPFVEQDPDAVKNVLMISCYGGFLVGQAAAKLMLDKGSGSIQFTGASASVKGYPQSASFAMGKFGLRGLAQSMARELAPKNIHVAHFVIDGGISKGPDDPRATRGEDGLLEPDAIAESYLYVHRQHRSAWTWEVELRPWVESF